ncbi:hypothetical protein [Corynebacterium variabile]|uniref:Uncharacterized protein n=1 Tax=Corynebacterium variabile TaxID=1727 RepID=A0A4Y4C8V6_9CORY|nr:hypothetical protein [Corynebacterium variabile]GEC87583.1 hypothetical protein CVA01_28970 [Corynebacterium variabile]
MVERHALADPRQCPDCHGPWKWGTIFTHDPACTIGNTDDGTRYNDMQRMDQDGVDYYTRVIRPHELRLCAAVGIPAGINWTVTVHRHGLPTTGHGAHPSGLPVGGGWVRAYNPPNGTRPIV